MALSFEESLALERQRLNLEALAASHQRAMEQMLIQQQRTVSSAWMCSKDRQRAESLWGIDESYLDERRRLEDRRMFTANLSVEQRQEIDQRLAYLEIEKTERIRVCAPRAHGMAAIERDLKAATQELYELKQQLADLLEFFTAMKGAFKVLNWVGKVAKPLAAIVMLGGACAGFWTAIKGGTSR